MKPGIRLPSSRADRAHDGATPCQYRGVLWPGHDPAAPRAGPRSPALLLPVHVEAPDGRSVPHVVPPLAPDTICGDNTTSASVRSGPIPSSPARSPARTGVGAGAGGVDGAAALVARFHHGAGAGGGTGPERSGRAGDTRAALPAASDALPAAAAHA